MKYVFVNGKIAIVIRYWEQRAADIEGGVRVDIRRVSQVVAPVDRPGASGFTVDPVGTGGIWRADLFIILNDGGKACFHYHPEFHSNDVGERHDEDDLAARPRHWIERTLRDLPVLLEKAGAGDIIDTVDMDEHAMSMPLIMTAIDHCMAQVPEALAKYA